MSTVGVFDFKIDISGAHIVVVGEPICSGCLSDREVDWEINTKER